MLDIGYGIGDPARSIVSWPGITAMPFSTLMPNTSAHPDKTGQVQGRTQANLSATILTSTRPTLSNIQQYPYQQLFANVVQQDSISPQLAGMSIHVLAFQKDSDPD
ncbi:hypothetical protein [Salinihabitans flavidus]|uniref:hypothetical protein n=1 Tax=Salinihabitans flavidus TaxID=569882 RepID=UPI001113F824|nr:hypothetical protein [Salinihabitans flavidus]